MSEPEAINSREYWDARFQASWEEKKGGDQTRFFAELLIDHLPEWFKADVAHHRLGICDWGCAEGEAVAYIGQIFPSSEVGGVDFARNAIQRARQKFPSHTFVAEDWLTRKTLRPKYDVVLSSNVLEHFREPLNVLRDVLGVAAKKYIVVMCPFAEDLGKMEPEHFFRFFKHTIPFSWGDWLCMYFEVIDTATISGSRWHGQQALMIYARRGWIEEAGLDFTLSNYPAEVGPLSEALKSQALQVADQAQQNELLKRTYEAQLAHDKIILNTNNQVQAQNERLREEHIKALARLKDLEVALANAELNLKEVNAIREERTRLEKQLLALGEAAARSEQEKARLQEVADVLRDEIKKGVVLGEQVGELTAQLAGEREARKSLEQQAAALRETLTQAERDKTHFESLRAQLVAQGDQMQEQAVALHGELERVRAILGQPAEECAALRERVGVLGAELEAASEARALLEDQLAALTEASARADRVHQDRLADLAREKEQLELIYAQLAQHDAKLSHQAVIHSNELEELRKALSGPAEERAALQERVTTLSLGLDATKEANRRLEIQLASLGEAAARVDQLHQDRLQGLSRDKETLELSHAQMTQHYQSIESQWAEQRQEYDALKGALAQLARQHVALQEMASALGTEKDTLNAEKDATREEQETAFADLAALRRQIEMLLREKEMLGRDKEELTVALQQLQHLTQRLGSDNAEHQQRLEKLEKSHATMTAQHHELSVAATGLQARLHNSETAQAQLTKRFVQESERIEVEKQELTRRNQSLSEELGRNRSAILAKDDQVARLQKDSTSLEQIKGMYYFRWAQKIDKLRARMRQLKHRAAANPSSEPPPPPEAEHEAGAVAMADMQHKVEAQAENAIPPAPPAAPTLAQINPEMRRRLSEPKPLRQMNVGVILDPFTRACIEPEFHPISIRPDNWRLVLAENAIDFLFVESAWKGNENAWQYRIGTYAAPPDHELDELLAWCKMMGIPTVFWNKEDPPHFNKFIEAAAKFDYVFTTDANCIPNYRERCGHDRIAALPFAAQQTIHNPILIQPRSGAVCFAGTYYADSFDERRQDMDVLLRGSAAFGLDIYDRMHGYQGDDQKRYQFPDDFKPFIRGKLDYEAMLQAYRSYRVFLNVNSVFDSPTMFARRVFELMACGTPVITTRSIGINQFFGDLVAQVKTAEDVSAALDRLLNHPEEWWRTSARGIRCVMNEHTYTHRLTMVCNTIGLPLEYDKVRRIGAVVLAEGDAARLAANIAAQSEMPTSIFILAMDNDAREFEQAFKNAGVRASLTTPEALLKVLHRQLAAKPIVFLSGHHFYGPNYLRDARLALEYSRCPISGMSTYYEARERDKLKCIDAGGEEYRKLERVFAPTIAAYGQRVTPDLIAAIQAGGMIQIGADCYARSRFEFLAGAAASSADVLLQRVCI